MKVMTYNICRGVFGSLDAVADTIVAEDPDLLLLQEVDIGTTRAKGVDQVAYLADKTGLAGVHGKAWDYLGGEAGSAIFSKYDISDVELFPLYRGHRTTREGREEPRICFRAKIHHPEQIFSAYSVHFGVVFTGSSPIKQSREFAAIVARDPHPVVAAGDYNHWPNHPVLTQVRDHLLDACPHRAHATETRRYTFPSPGPQVCLDYILHSEHFGADAHAVADSRASDHRPVRATLHFT